LINLGMNSDVFKKKIYKVSLVFNVFTFKL